MHFVSVRVRRMWMWETLTYILIKAIRTRTQLMNKEVPWRGGREKASKSLQVFIEAITKPRDVVHDAYTSICNIVAVTYIVGLRSSFNKA